MGEVATLYHSLEDYGKEGCEAVTWGHVGTLGTDNEVIVFSYTNRSRPPEEIRAGQVMEFECPLNPIQPRDRFLRAYEVVI